MGTVKDVKGGWLEHEIRSLPQVLACSITADDVVVLIQQSADPVAVERSVQELLRRSAIDRPVRVFGGVRPLFVEPVRVRNGRSALIGSIGGAAVLAAGIWIAGATTGLRGGTKVRATVATLAPPVARELVTIPAVGGDGSAAPQPDDQPLPPLLRPASSPILRQSVGQHRETRPATREPGGPTSSGSNASCQGPPDRGAPREIEGRHNGNGPMPWSHSVLVPPNCSRGRP